jgi:hypothetical protein
MGTATPGAILGLLIVFLILAILPLILIRRDSLEDEVDKKKPGDSTVALRKNYNEAYEAAGSCVPCTEDGRTARLRIYRNIENTSLLLLSCPSCGSVFRANPESKNL